MKHFLVTAAMLQNNKEGVEDFLNDIQEDDVLVHWDVSDDYPPVARLVIVAEDERLAIRILEDFMERQDSVILGEHTARQMWVDKQVLDDIDNNTLNLDTVHLV